MSLFSSWLATILQDKLSIPYSPIQDSSLRHLTRLTELTELRIIKSEITDVGLKQIGQLTNLQSLVLPGTKITDQGLPELHGMKNLRHLQLNPNEGVTAEGIAELRKALPDCEIDAKFSDEE